MTTKLEGREKVNTHVVANKVNEIIDELNEIHESISKIKDILMEKKDEM